MSELKVLSIRKDRNIINPAQLNHIISFIKAGRAIPEVMEYVIEETGFERGSWDQLMIYLAVSSILPKNTQFSPSACIDTVWHTFICCTKQYKVFFKKLDIDFIHHVPDKLKDNTKAYEEKWFEIEAFLNELIPEFDPKFWPGGGKSTPVTYDDCDRGYG